ncbi:hypothetical protein [Pampinifervens florentissimum]|uniref:hypothetical protein n=1 Tax=Pampinifervens florentissimum TaxID=1632019 RepID=UPI0013B49924|nr:hypothetical protein [Hydrogenobacter sp. T-8]QID32322.1 hypothetical protein G3M65_00410 [Hydrogenobacter sp. T-8]
MVKVKVLKDTELRINGVRYIVKAGVQDVERHVAELLLQLSLAEQVAEKEERREERNDKRRRG